MKKTAIVLLAHGVPSHDWLLEKEGKALWEIGKKHMHDLSEKIKDLPRTPATDPFKFDSEHLAEVIKAKLRDKFDNIELGYNEFCSPSTADAVDKVIKKGAKKVIFVGIGGFITPHFHTLIDVPASIEEAKKKYPGIKVVYAKPGFDYNKRADTYIRKIEKSRRMTIRQYVE